MIYSTRYIVQIIGFAVLGAFLAFSLSFLRPLEYSSTVRLLIIQRGNVPGDAYNAIKSVEGISETLSQVVTTSSFFDKVLANEGIDRRPFRGDERKKRKKWQKTISAQVQRGTGFLDITIYHASVSQARELTNIISRILIAEGWQFVSTPIEVKMVDSPVVSRFPVRPNFLANALAGFMLGGIIALVYQIRKVKSS